MKSIITNQKKCYVCGTNQDLHKHHIFEGTSNRAKSETFGCWCYLCGKHHNLSDEGVHFNKELEMSLKQTAQREFEIKYNHDLFMQTFKKNYITEVKPISESYDITQDDLPFQKVWT